jgi:hypothetical protein
LDRKDGIFLIHSNDPKGDTRPLGVKLAWAAPLTKEGLRGVYTGDNIFIVGEALGVELPGLRVGIGRGTKLHRCCILDIIE